MLRFTRVQLIKADSTYVIGADFIIHELLHNLVLPTANESPCIVVWNVHHFYGKLCSYAMRSNYECMIYTRNDKVSDVLIGWQE